jgi:hypoxanthine phosphoribosyltransferase
MIDHLGIGCVGVTTPHSRNVRTGAHVQRILKEHCHGCALYPCLASSACGHEDELRVLQTVCPQGKWRENIRWVRTVDRTVAVERLIASVPADVTAVAGVPRSGMAAAGQIAEALHMRLYAIHASTGLVALASGERFSGERPDDGTLLIVDDTVASGLSMYALRERIREISTRRRVLTAVVYASPEAAHTVDLYAEILPLPHFLQWNFFNSIHTPNVAFDFDGILCEDCPAEDDDDGPRYVRFLETAKPKYLVRSCEIPLIVTARLEKYRALTEAWLRRCEVRCRELVMGPWAERSRAYDIGQFKGQVFHDSAVTIFVESCPIQARAIADVSGKRVICPATGEIHR